MENPGSYSPRQIPVLLRGEVNAICGWLARGDAGRPLLYLAVIALGAGFYGAAMGYWRAPFQALYTGIKFPLVLLLTTFGNALLNGMFAPLLGLNISFRQSLLAILMSYTIAAAILGAFSPLVAFLVWNLPPMGSNGSGTAHSLLIVIQVAIISFAGTTANLRLYQLLRQLAGSTPVARRVLCAWLAGNLFLGSQLSWILRPFIGQPALPVEFLRADAFHGSFFESVLHALRALFA